MTFTIHYGVLMPSLEKQITSMKLKFDKETLDVFQNEVDCMQTLYLADLLTDNERDKVMKRIHKGLTDYIKSENKK